MVSASALLADSLPVRGIYLDSDMAELLADCTGSEKQIIKDTAAALKRSLRERR